MFARPRPKRAALVPPPKRRKTNPAVEEVNFDFDARSEYLTGFHKRKLLRSKKAQEENAKKEREEKIAMRKQASYTIPHIRKWVLTCGVSNSCEKSESKILRDMSRL